MRYRVAYVVDGRTQYTGSFSSKRSADTIKARLHLTYAFVHVETMPEADEAKHTPGPWELESDEQSGKAIYVTVRTGELDHAIATVDTPCNARLIAAAPDMLEALQAIAEADGQPDEVLQMAMIRARAVLAEINQE